MIAITGINGFVGSNLASYLVTNQYKCVSLDLRAQRIPSLDLDTKILIHLAGKAHDLKQTTNPDEYYDINSTLTKQVYDQFLKSNCSIFIFMSSVKAVSDTVSESLTEDMIPEPSTHYGKSKNEAEKYILSQPQLEGKRIFILRPCMIHGPGNKGNLNLLYKVAKLGIPYPLASFENQRSFLSIENLCFVIKELIERTDIPSGIYNVADDLPLSTNRVVQIMCETILKRPRLWRINKNVIKGITSVGDFLSLPLNSERLQKLTESYVVSNAKLLTALNKPLPVSAEDGLRKTIQSFADGK